MDRLKAVTKDGNVLKISAMQCTDLVSELNFEASRCSTFPFLSYRNHRRHRYMYSDSGFEERKSPFEYLRNDEHNLKNEKKFELIE